MGNITLSQLIIQKNSGKNTKEITITDDDDDDDDDDDEDDDNDGGNNDDAKLACTEGFI